MTQSAQMIGIGELLWDCFPDRRLPGGAPANVAFHAQQLGLTSAVASRVGSDELGDEICGFLVSQGLTTDLIQRDDKRQTGTVTVSPVSAGETNYCFLENSAWDYLEASLKLLDAVRTSKAICFGTLAQRRPASRSAIQKCLHAAPSDCQIVYDVNLRPPFFVKDWITKSLERARILKLNSEEVKVLSKLFDLQVSDDVRFAKLLLDRHKQLELVCVTRGGDGCMAATCDEMIELPGVPVEVVDTVGAGDAFTAAVIFGRIEKWSLAKTLDLANHFGSLVAGRAGAMPVLGPEIETLKRELDWAYRNTPRP